MVVPLGERHYLDVGSRSAAAIDGCVNVDGGTAALREWRCRTVKVDQANWLSRERAKRERTKT